MKREGNGHLTPAEMAERTCVSLDTLRYHERVELIIDIERGASGHRRYSAGDVGWVDVLRCLRTTELCRMAGTEARRLDLLVEHRDDVVAPIAELQQRRCR